VPNTRKLKASTRTEAREYVLIIYESITGHWSPACRDDTVANSTLRGFSVYDKTLLNHIPTAGENSMPGNGHETDRYPYPFNFI